MHEELAGIGKSIVLTGELSGDEDLTVEGRVEGTIRSRFYFSACGWRWVLQNRDISIMFAGLELCDSVLLKSGVREILFRKSILS